MVQKYCQQKKMKQIIVYTCGDSTDISTWSNVPYLFTKTLEERGYLLHRVDISPNKKLNRFFNTCSFYIFKRLLKLSACPEFHRTGLHRFLTYRKIRQATKSYPDIAFNLFLSFAFYNPYSSKPNVLWCDWTDAMVIERLGRRPKWYEKKSLKHECKVLAEADVVYSLFPVCARQMEVMYKRPVLYLERNVINTVYDGDFNIHDIVDEKRKSNIILFVGNLRYQEAARELIRLYPQLKAEVSNVELHIVGMTNQQLGVIEEGIYCHGYLHKNVAEERDMYYSLMLRAKVFVNSTPKWGGYSSTVEAMFYGCPVIVSPYDDFVAEFGADITFGKYVNERNDLYSSVKDILQSDDYDRLVFSAHGAVKDYTWNCYIDVLLDSLRQHGIIDDLIV